MDEELRQYLAAIVMLLSLNAGFLATLVWVSGDNVSPGFVVVPAVVLGTALGGVVWMAASFVGEP